MRVPAILIGLAMAAAAVEAQAADTPESVVAAFCALRDTPDQAVYAPLITPSLQQIVDAAWAKNQEFEKAHPGDKPPLGDGIQFQAYPDRAPICRPGVVSSGATDTAVDVEYVFPDTEGSDWTDRLVLLPEGDRLLIDDVLYGPEQFNLGLRAVLQSIIDGKF